ncbi:wiSP family protein [Prevotella veroralis]|uniref:wiSP family protein n=1 Tax=Prevotella veroralis TaxID=28137 RepID=UPI0012DD2584|nr:wiSP family protein [Prevotella veroralis]
MKKRPRCLMVSLQSRDRRHRLETPPSLPQGEECLMVIYLNGSFYPKGCHRVGTDALVCPSKHS